MTCKEGGQKEYRDCPKQAFEPMRCKPSTEKEIMNALQLKDGKVEQTMEKSNKLTHLCCRQDFCTLTFVNVPCKCQAYGGRLSCTASVSGECLLILHCCVSTAQAVLLVQMQTQAEQGCGLPNS